MTFSPDGPAESVDPVESASPDQPVAPAPDVLDHRELVVRQAPKAPPFLVGGAVLGVLAALIVTSLGVDNPEFTFGSTFGYFVVLFGILGTGVGALIWLVLDRRSKRHTRTVTAEAVEDYGNADYAVQEHELQQWSDKWENGDRDQDAR
ncbi:hypothetical protein [Citricoccus sp. GCM10030269]|uniref:hypothetical protein n=1 Tax=Citricoccus sp. GCM10030269 TaxID=3273388 RepID=UPI00360F6CF3